MNKRIRELAREAGLLVHNPNGVPTKLEKFAEMIVRECIDTAFHKGHPDLEFLLKHFGVEE